MTTARRPTASNFARQLYFPLNQRGRGRFALPLSRLSELALRQRKAALAKLPPVAGILRGSLMERYVTCGNPSCKCARGERHGPSWYLSVTLGPGRATGSVIPEEKVDEVRGGVENYHQVKDQLEKISDINRELLRRERSWQHKRGRKE